jgi:hypothetical protein
MLSTVSNMELSDWIAFAAIIIAFVSAIWTIIAFFLNRQHAERLFARQFYPHVDMSGFWKEWERGGITRGHPSCFGIRVTNYHTSQNALEVLVQVYYSAEEKGEWQWGNSDSIGALPFWTWETRLEGSSRWCKTIVSSLEGWAEILGLLTPDQDEGHWKIVRRQPFYLKFRVEWEPSQYGVNRRLAREVLLRLTPIGNGDNSSGILWDWKIEIAEGRQRPWFWRWRYREL